MEMRCRVALTLCKDAAAEHFLAFDDGEDFVLTQEHVLLCVHGDVVARVFSEQNAVTNFDLQLLALAVLVEFARSYGDHFAFLLFFFGAIRNEDTACAFLFAFCTLDKYAIIQRFYVHRFLQSGIFHAPNSTEQTSINRLCASDLSKLSACISVWR